MVYCVSSSPVVEPTLEDPLTLLFGFLGLPELEVDGLFIGKVVPKVAPIADELLLLIPKVLFGLGEERPPLRSSVLYIISTNSIRITITIQIHIINQ